MLQLARAAGLNVDQLRGFFIANRPAEGEPGFEKFLMKYVKNRFRRQCCETPRTEDKEWAWVFVLDGLRSLIQDSPRDHFWWIRVHNRNTGKPVFQLPLLRARRMAGIGIPQV